MSDFGQTRQDISCWKQVGSNASDQGNQVKTCPAHLGDEHAAHAQVGVADRDVQHVLFVIARHRLEKNGVEGVVAHRDAASTLGEDDDVR